MSATNNKMWMPSGFKQKIVELVLEIAHAKRKRCLAMASKCKAGMYLSYECVSKREWWEKWHNRWMKLSEYYTED